MTASLAPSVDSTAVFVTPRVAIRTIIAAEAVRAGIDPDQLLGRSRKRQIVQARHAAMRAIKNRCPHMGMPDIARIFGCDRTTVLYVLNGGKSARRP